MKIPDKLKVGGFEYKVIKNHIFKETELAGQVDHRTLVIRLSKTTPNGEDYHQTKIEECFIHELLHCIDCVYNNNKSEEDVIDRLSVGLYQVLKDNSMGETDDKVRKKRRKV